MKKAVCLFFLCALIFGYAASSAYCYGKGKGDYILYYHKYDINSEKAKFLIEITGRTNWSEEKVNDMILLSAANVAVKNGYSYFTEISRKKFPHFFKINWKIYIYGYRAKPQDYEGEIYKADDIQAELNKKYGIG